MQQHFSVGKSDIAEALENVVATVSCQPAEIFQSAVAEHYNDIPVLYNAIMLTVHASNVRNTLKIIKHSAFPS